MTVIETMMLVLSSSVIIDKLEFKCKENMKGIQYNLFFFC